MPNMRFFKINKEDRIWWVNNEERGELLFTFDQKTIFSLFKDYPHALNTEQKELFDKENPFWSDFFKEE